jgi:hypothetical protein
MPPSLGVGRITHMYTSLYRLKQCEGEQSTQAQARMVSRKDNIRAATETRSRSHPDMARRKTQIKEKDKILPRKREPQPRLTLKRKA